MIRKILNLFKKQKNKTVLATNLFTGVTYRFTVHNNNQIWLSWFGVPFKLRMIENNKLLIDDRYYAGYGKEYSGWYWKEDDGGEYAKADY